MATLTEAKCLMTRDSHVTINHDQELCRIQHHKTNSPSTQMTTARSRSTPTIPEPGRSIAMSAVMCLQAYHSRTCILYHVNTKSIIEGSGPCTVYKIITRIYPANENVAHIRDTRCRCAGDTLHVPEQPNSIR